MILEVAHLRVDPTQTEAYEAAIAEAGPLIASADGYLGHEFLRSDDEPGRYLLVVRWRSRADHVDGFRGSEAYEQWRRLLHPFYDPIPEVSYFEPLG